MSDVEPPQDPPLEIPRGSLATEWPIFVVLAGIVAGLLVVVVLDRFRRGTVLMSAAVVLGAWLRLMLPSERAGVLAVRRKSVDVACLSALGLGLLVIALVVPAPS